MDAEQSKAKQGKAKQINLKQIVPAFVYVSELT